MRLKRLTDYASLILSVLAESPTIWQSAPLLAKQVSLPGATVSKVLKLLTKAGLLRTTRGHQGGYQLAYAPKDISLSQIIRAIEGPILLTECSQGAANCPLESHCTLKKPWRQLNQVMSEILDKFSLSDLLNPVSTKGNCL
jgi:FeS assembly SUF system regulator